MSEPEPLLLIRRDKTIEEIDDVLDEQLDQIFDQQYIVLHEVCKLAERFDPIDLAHAVTRLPAKARIIVFSNLPDLESKESFIIHTGKNTRSTIFRQMSNEEITSLIEQMAPNEIVEIIEDLSERRIKKVLEGLPLAKQRKVRELQTYERMTAGRLMTNEFFSFLPQTTIHQIRKEIRNTPGIDLVSPVFVVDANACLIGMVPDRTLIISPQDASVASVMSSVPHTANPETHRDDVVDIVERYGLSALPVVDADQKLRGVISYEDAVDAMRDIADETIANIAGTAEDFSEDEPTINRILYRTPWLLVTLIAGITTSTLMTSFKGTFWFEYAPYFVPLISMMSGNVGIQCSTILVRWMSQGEFSSESKKEAFVSEMTVGGSLGLCFGVFCAFLIWILSFFGLYTIAHDLPVVISMVSIGLFVACFSASFLGTLSPIIFDRLRIDPAVASGPIVAALNDVLSTSLFILVAYWIHYFFSSHALA